MSCPHYKSVFDPSAQREAEIRCMARDTYGAEGNIEIAGAARISEGDDNGCYVETWVWVDFSGTEFDKGSRMKTVAVNADALRQVLNALNGPSFYIREMQVTHSPIFPDNPINILCDDYNAAVKAHNASQGEPK